MTAGSSPLRRISEALQRHAYRVCPARGQQWILAACNELGSLTSPYESLVWSIGTVQVAYRARVSAMSIREPMILKPILVLEAACCFVPATVLWVWTLLSAPGASLATFERLYAAMAISIGPVGLALFGQLLLARPPHHARGQAIALTLLAGCAFMVVLIPALTPIPLKELPWRDSVLLLLLPTVGAAHYSFLARRPEPLTTPSRPAVPP